MKREKIKTLLLSEGTDREVLVKGWVRTKRGGKNIVFIALNDGSTIKNIQVVADVSGFGEAHMKEITTGACIAVRAVLAGSEGGGQDVEIRAESIVL